VARFLILAFLASGCVVHVQARGVLESQGEDLLLLDAEGGRLRLVGEGAVPLSALAGCGVELEGVRRGKALRVTDWKVTVAPDGSIPFVGPLRHHGSNLVLADQNSGGQVVLEAGSAQDLRPFAGGTVLVIGYTVGPQLVRVVAWTVLVEP
jgi:hypothetical protein